MTPFVVDVDVRTLPPPRAWRPGDPLKEVPRRWYPKPGTAPVHLPEPGPDALVELQQRAAEQPPEPSAFTTPSRSFPGQGFTGVTPPDTNGDVGPNHYIQTINTSGGTAVGIWDKGIPTPTQLAQFTLDSLGSGSCASGFGDPVVIYDRQADRWLLSEFSGSGNHLCVYVSQTPNPVSGGWFAYDFTTPNFPDYPKYAVWPTDVNGGAGSYLVTSNDGGPGVYALDRGKMLVGQPATFQRLTIPGLPGFGFEAPTAADVDGPTPPPAGAPALIMRHRDTESHSGPAAPADLIENWAFNVNWTTPANTTLVVQPAINISEFDSDLCGLSSFSCFPQPGTSTTLDPLREVIMHRLSYFNYNGDHQSIVGNFVTDVDGSNHGGVRWFELRGSGASWSVFQEGTYSIDSNHRWMGSIAIDQTGNIALGYNVSSTSVFPSLRYTGRLVTDPLGVMSQPESVIHNGTASNGSNRYGDYAMMSLDPADDCTFWFTGEDNTSSSWRTQIASFRFEACGCALFPDPLAVSASPSADNTIAVSWNDATLNSVVEYRVRRSRTPGGPYTQIATIPDSSLGVANGTGYTFEDHDVSGGIHYYYIVIASDGLACNSSTSNEANATGTGACTLAPVFAGVQSVTAPAQNTCTINIGWNAAAPECGGPSSYNVYRSTSASFTPSANNRVAENLSGTAYTDIDGLADGTTYYYAVRAVDQANGVEEGNTTRLSSAPHGALVHGTWVEDGGDTGTARLVGSGTWSVASNEGNFGPKAYKTGTYPNAACIALVTPTIHLGLSSTLTFYSKYDIENGHDKGLVQITVNNGQTWTRLSVNYPAASFNTGDTCGLPGAGATYFTGTNLSYAAYTANLAPFGNNDVKLRFLLSSDGAIPLSGWWIDDIAITDSDVAGACITGSACASNPYVDVQPDGPQTLCALSPPELDASLTGGVEPFSYQWYRDGAAVPGANGPTFLANTLGQHNYNCRVQSAECGAETFDGVDTALKLENAPNFGGVTLVTDPQQANCTLNVSWSPASTSCPGPLAYSVYRATNPGVTPTPANLVASGVTGTSFNDASALNNQQTYYYLVRAFDGSTNNTDTNTVVRSGVPSGPGSGLQTFLNETFENAGTFASWSVTTGPGAHSCGAWSRTSGGSQLPTGGSGFYAWANNQCAQVLPRTSSILTSPIVNVNGLGTVLSVTLEYDLFYSFGDGGDTATVEVFNGSTWQVIWTDPNATVNGHQSFNVSAQAIGNPNFRVRFNYQNAVTDHWFSVDNVKVTALVDNACTTRVGPPPAPEGSLHAARTTVDGSQLQLSWNAASCPAPAYNLLYGDLANVSSYSLSGSRCGLGGSGSYAWTAVPPGDLYFMIVGASGTVESSWGIDGDGIERHGMFASGQCGVTAKDIAIDCP
ncbi:MAG TPA: hypothetical protein VJS92_17785 [Candidatus Polarisedimenticolaceae bacterium]|nr:hypothetical protein [Candidatus Polarisedimenticolaceae bacterium]